MRILFLTHYFVPEVNAPASRTYENALRWVRAGHEVTVITCAPSAPRGIVYAGYRNRPRTVEWMQGIKVVRVWTLIAANKGTFRRIANYLSYMISACLAAQFEVRPDVMVATSPQFFCGWAGVLLKRLQRWRFVLEIRDIWPESITTVGAMRKGATIRFLERMERRMYAAADRIVTVGRGYRDNLISKGVPPDALTVIYNGVDLDTFRPRPPDPGFRRRFGLEGKRVCGYIGTVGMAHGLEIILRAAARTRGRDWTWLIVGDGARLDDLRAQASTQGLDNVVFTGRLPKEEMPAAWSSLDACLIHLRKSELFETVIPSKMFEAMGMEIPILMGVAGEAAELATQAAAGLTIPPEDDGALIEGFARIVAEGNGGYGRAGRAFVARAFDRDALAKDYLDLLAAAAGSPPRDIPAKMENPSWAGLSAKRD